MADRFVRVGTGARQRLAFVLPLLVCVGLVCLGLGGCDPRDCALGIAHRDCYAVGAPQAQFPQDDDVCRSYGLGPGTRDYADCRRAKRHVRALTNRETDFGALQNPLTPDVRPIYPVR